MSEPPTASHRPADQPSRPPRHVPTDSTAHDQQSARRRVSRTADWGKQKTDWGKQKYSGSWAEYLWHRLDAADFMNQAVLLAATLLLCAVPFFLVVAALAGRPAVSALSARLGLSKQAAADVGHLFASSSTTSNAVSGLSWLFFILAGIAAATAIQRLYQRVFDQAPRGPRDTLRAIFWLAAATAWFAFATSFGPGFRASAPVLWWIVNIPAFIAFWWFTMWFLLAGRVSWRRLYPCAVATGAFWLGMLAVFTLIFSSMVISYDRKYGPIGIVFGLMSFFIAIGVVITLGAAVGQMWQDRGLSFGAAVRKLRRGSRRHTPARRRQTTPPGHRTGAAGSRLTRTED
jgi:membrane protein